jgi:membrane-associated phospholipid phosphatase
MSGSRLRRTWGATLTLVLGASCPTLAAAQAPGPPAKVKDSALPNAPNEPPAVPSPGPEFLGGRPRSPERRIALLRWPWTPIGTTDYVIGGLAGATTLAAAIVHPLPTHYLEGGILFDDAVRNAVRPSSIQVRYAFRDASDVELSFAATWPFFADALAGAWWFHGDREVAEQMALLDLETLAIAGAVQGVTNVLVSRQRPYGQYCGTPGLPANALDCAETTEYRSFFSGHATFTFTSAALICINHAGTELFGSLWDALTCGTGYAVAATTASFRVLADMHYASDVIVGALVGTIIGYGVPYLHSRKRDFGELSTHGITLHIVPSVGGISGVGTF